MTTTPDPLRLLEARTAEVEARTRIVQAEATTLARDHVLRAEFDAFRSWNYALARREFRKVARRLGKLCATTDRGAELETILKREIRAALARLSTQEHDPNPKRRPVAGRKVRP